MPGAGAGGAAALSRSCGDAIPGSLTGARAMPRAAAPIVANRQVGLCLLCHSGPFPEEQLPGHPRARPQGRRRALVGGPAAAADRRCRAGSIRRRSCRPITGSTASRASRPRFRGKPILTAEQIEDVVAFLMTLRD